MSGHASSNSVHRARPPAISRSSFANSGQIGALCASDVSGEGKKDVLQVCAGTIGSATQLFEGTDAPDSAVRQQRETITDLFGISELMNRQEQRAATRCYAPQHGHHVARVCLRSKPSNGSSISRI